MRRIVHAAALLLTLPATQPGLAAQPAPGIAPVKLTADVYHFDTAEQHGIRVEVIARGLNHPFALALLPGGDALVSERGGALRLVRNVTGSGAARLEPAPIVGLPALDPPYRNSGLHDLALHPDFAGNRLVYFTFNKAGRPPAATAGGPPPRQESRVALLRGRLEGNALTGVEELFVGESYHTSGSRITFGADGLLYMTTGAPFDDAAQDPGSTLP